MNINKKVLIVDDQKDLREQLAKLLKNANKRNETSSLVQQMRSRLLGKQAEVVNADGPDEDCYSVDTAGQGEEGYELIKKSIEQKAQYAIIFLDMRMPPGWDGLETAKKIREIDKDIEIVIMTAYADHDQKAIAGAVGTPEKLLYIKKPFHTEEIFQLALSLTAKWSLERRVLDKKHWLELLVKSMSRIQYTSSYEDKSFHQTILKALTDFIETEKGFILEKSSGAGCDGWRTLCSSKFDPKEIDEFTAGSSQLLEGLTTAHNSEGRFLLPLKKDKYFAVGVMGEVVANSDPEWYKFLSLLLMTATNALRNAAKLEREGMLSLSSAATKIKTLVEKAKELQKSTPNAPALAEIVSIGEDIQAQISKKD